MALKYFTNASENYKGQSIAINPDIVASVFELKRPYTNGKRKKTVLTVIYGIDGTDWLVEEPYLEVVASLNSD